MSGRRKKKLKGNDAVKTLIIREDGDLVGWIEVDDRNRIYIVQSVEESEKRTILRAFEENPWLTPLQVAERILKNQMGYEVKVG